MSVAVVSDGREKMLFEKREEVFTRYKALWDIPEEKKLYDMRFATSSLSEEDVKKNPIHLAWMVDRLKYRIQEAKKDLEIALGQVESNKGILKLCGKNLCDLTAAVLYPNVRGVWKVELSRNFLKKLPDFCLLKPMIFCVNASSNLQDIEREFYSIREKNRTCFDLFYLLEAAYQTTTDTDHQLVYMMQQIYENPSKLMIAHLATNIYEHYAPLIFPNTMLEVHPKSFLDMTFGGLSSFIELKPFRNLQKLDLSHCRLEFRAPTNWLEGLSSLNVLNLSHSTLKEVPLGVKNLTNLVSLDLSSTGIEKLPDWISIEDLPVLKILNLSRTKIDRLPQSFSLLEVEELNLENCPIRDLQYVPRTVRLLNIKGSLVEFIPIDLEELLKENRIEIGETNTTSLVMQKEVFSRYRNRKLARFFIDRFKDRKRGCLPVAIQVHVNACSVFGWIGLFAIGCLLYILCIPLIATCHKNRSKRGPLLLTNRPSDQNYKASVLMHIKNAGFYFKDLARMTHDVRLIASNP